MSVISREEFNASKSEKFIEETFGGLCNDISEGLPAEIDARQKQYDYYRDKLLNFKEKEASS